MPKRNPMNSANLIQEMLSKNAQVASNRRTVRRHVGNRVGYLVLSHHQESAAAYHHHENAGRRGKIFPQAVDRQIVNASPHDRGTKSCHYKEQDIDRRVRQDQRTAGENREGYPCRYRRENCCQQQGNPCHRHCCQHCSSRNFCSGSCAGKPSDKHQQEINPGDESGHFGSQSAAALLHVRQEEVHRPCNPDLDAYAAAHPDTSKNKMPERPCAIPVFDALLCLRRGPA